MKLSEIYKIADEIAPKRLSDEYCKNYGAYDNSGVLVDTGDEVKGVLFTLDLSGKAIAKAREIGANLIVTHHPAIYGKISHICDNEPLGGKLVDCIKNGISVLSMHLNLDGAAGGIDESLMEGVCLSAGGKGAENAQIMHPLTGGGYGRAYSVKKISLADLARNMEKVFSTERVLVYGDKTKKIDRAASFCGSGVDEGAIAFAAKNSEGGSGVIISSDFKHHLIALALEEGLSVIVLTHYASENYGFYKYYEKMRRQLKIPCEYHTDTELL
ncbi:MAG: Nif3-like dinuclear metal center hexameric protein [Clostridia bacterium]|nr:Nif3-like dinuclear metal center hexameric protein [Clostridia bacterium]